jgi:uncharacterized protein (TIGR01244 family)
MDNPLPIRAVAPDVCVAPQLTPEAMAEVARQGFKSVINNRPDFEHGPDQPRTRPSPPQRRPLAWSTASCPWRRLPVARRDRGLCATAAEPAAADAGVLPFGRALDAAVHGCAVALGKHDTKSAGTTCAGSVLQGLELTHGVCQRWAQCVADVHGANRAGVSQ